MKANAFRTGICHCSAAPQGVRDLNRDISTLPFIKPIWATCMWMGNKEDYSPGESSGLSNPSRGTATYGRIAHLSVQP